jgi:sortase (surface protein transpeptidase)
MSVWRVVNPFRWSRGVTVGVFGGFFAVCLPLWFSGLSVFAHTVNPVNATLKIGAIGLVTPVVPVEISGGEGLKTPEKLVGSYTSGSRVFLYAHNSGVFRNLHELVIGDEIEYTKAGERGNFSVSYIERLPRDEIKMSQILRKSDRSEIVLMTCAGERLADGDYAERLIIYAGE